MNQQNELGGTPAALPPSPGTDTTTLQPLTAALLECITPGQVVEVVVRRGVAVLGADAGMVVLARDTAEGDDSQGYLEIVGAQGFEEAVVGAWGRFAIADSLPLSDAVRERTPLFWTNRAEMAARYPEMFRRGPIHTINSSASLPLIARGRVIGGLHFSFPRERETFTAAERAFLQEMTRQCALALDRALLLEEIEEARRRQEYLARASALLAESLDYQTTLEAITRLAVPDLCDWAAVDMVDEGGKIRHLAVAHTNPSEVAWVREAQQRFPVDMTQKGQPIVHVIATGETVFLPDIPEEVLLAAARDAEHLRLIRKLGLRSYVCVPLTARGKTLGAVTFASSRSTGRVFTPELAKLVEELGRRAAFAVDNARLYSLAQRETAERREAEIAREKLVDELKEASLRQRRFLKEMLAGFTEGRLRLCFGRRELPDSLPPLSDTLELSPTALRLLRKHIEAVAEGVHFPKERLSDLLTATHEAAMNAVRHAGGGTARIHGSRETGQMQVWIQDNGPGIAEEMIHRAVEQGFTTGGFGQGFFYIQSCADRLYLLSSTGAGTTVVLEMDRKAPHPAWLGTTELP